MLTRKEQIIMELYLRKENIHEQYIKNRKNYIEEISYLEEEDEPIYVSLVDAFGWTHDESVWWDEHHKILRKLLYYDEASLSLNSSVMRSMTSGYVHGRFMLLDGLNGK